MGAVAVAAAMAGSACAETAPVTPEDRKALAGIGATLKLHGVVPLAEPKLDAADRAWQRYGARMVKALAGKKRRKGFDPAVRPLAPAVKEFLPDHPRYRALQTYLHRLVLGLQEGIPTIRKVRYRVEMGKSAPEVGALRKRLLLEGYGKRDVPERLQNYFDKALRNAMRRWQRDNGLGQTNHIDNLTRWRLNRHDVLVGKVMLALQRWRQHTLGDGSGRHVMVHINRGQLTAEVDGKAQLQFAIIAGRATKEDATPAMSSAINKVIINPAWRVPKRITEELKKNVGGDVDKLRERGYSVRVDGSRWHITKPPGSDNPLGKLIFRMPASNGIFLHDTNSKSLFSRKRRTLSHGCVRLQRPRDLARWVLPASEHALVDRLMANGQIKHLTVAHPVPTHLVYMTLEMDTAGNPVALPDTYGWDPDAVTPLAAQAKKLVGLTWEPLQDAPPLAGGGATTPSTKDPAVARKTPVEPKAKPAYRLAASVKPLSGGASWTLERFKGRLLVLTFLASWCDNCHKLAPKLKKVIDGFRAQGHDVALLGVGIDEAGPKAVADYAAKHKLPFPVVMGGPELHSGVTPLGRIERLPTTWIIGRTGVPLYSFEGRDSAKPLKGDLERYLTAEQKLAKDKP